MKTSYKLEIFDADVGGNVHEQVFDSSDEALDEIKSVIDNELADSRETEEAELWFAHELYKRLGMFVNHAFATFFDSVSVWLPGHHRKITITKTEENR